MNEKVEALLTSINDRSDCIFEDELNEIGSLIKHELTTITAENIELENSLRIAQDRIEELENKYELDGYDEGRY